MLKLITSFFSAESIARLIADYVTKALQKIGDKDRAAKIAAATAAVGKATEITANAVEDCKITEEEANAVAESVKLAVEAIIKAAK